MTDSSPSPNNKSIKKPTDRRPTEGVERDSNWVTYVLGILSIIFISSILYQAFWGTPGSTFDRALRGVLNIYLIPIKALGISNVAYMGIIGLIFTIVIVLGLIGLVIRVLDRVKRPKA